MSEIEHTNATAEPTVTEAMTSQQPETTGEASRSEPPFPVAPVTDSKDDEITPNHQPQGEAAVIDEKKDESTALPEKVVEPITEGQLNYKGPGLLKSLIPSKKDFWLSDEPVTSQELSSYMRGEKPEVAHPVVAWASQTGKGLLFFNKKGDSNRNQPGQVLALYDATDLRKRNPQEISFSITGHEHVLKAATDAERDGWFISIEKTSEMGKASKDEMRESEGYKEELEKLNKPHVAATAATVASKRGQSQPKKSSEVDRHTSDAEDQKKEKKPRSTSRGVLNRFMGKKDETEPKKEEKEADKEHIEPAEEHRTEEVAGGAALVGGGAAGVAALESSEDTKDSTESPVETSKTEEKPKAAKRGSIFGKMAGWGGMKSPTKEKDAKDAELKPDVSPNDGVSEEPPVLPETATTERTDPEAEADKIEDKAEKEVEKENATEEAKKEEVATPSKEKSGFLSGFLPKRNRSVSPANLTNQTASPIPVVATEEPAKTEEPTIETPAAETVESPTQAETPTSNKRESVLGSLGRRASKAMHGMRPQKKENVAPTGEATKEETTDATTTTEIEQPAVNGEIKSTETEQPIIGDVVPSAIHTGQEQPPAVAASA